MFWKVVIFLLFASLVLRFVLKYILPIARLTKGMRQRLQDVQEQMNQQQAAQQNPRNKQVEGDFIEYEEVK